MGMKGAVGQGCTHQGPLLAYTTICWPRRAPVTRPEIVSTFSRPPCMAGGTLLNSMEGPAVVGLGRQPHSNKQRAKTISTRTKVRNASRSRERRSLLSRDGMAWNLTGEWGSTIMTGGGSCYRPQPYFANTSAHQV